MAAAFVRGIKSALAIWVSCCCLSVITVICISPSSIVAIDSIVYDTAIHVRAKIKIAYTVHVRGNFQKRKHGSATIVEYRHSDPHLVSINHFGS